MSKAFYEAVQGALETYACSLGSEPWFYAAAGFAAAGQGVGALAATIGGVATATACERPPGPGPDAPFITFDSGPSDGKLYNWQIVTEGTARTFDQQKGGPDDSFCNYSKIESYNSDGWRPTVSAQRIKLRVALWPGGGAGSCGTKFWRVEQQIDDATTWLGVAAGITINGWEHGVTAWAYKLNAPKPPRPPLPAPPPIKINLSWTENNINVNNDIKIEAPDFIFAPNGDFVLSFPVNVQVGPVFALPFSFNFDLNYSTGGDTAGGDGFGNKPAGGGPKLPPAERPSECPEIPDPPQISGSWSKADCINGQPLFTPVNWSGQGFAGVADALNKLNQVIGPWQEETYDCNNDLPMEPLFGIPVSEYRGIANFEPHITLYFYEPNLLAIEAGRANRIRRRITIPVAVPPANPNAFLDTEAAFWEGYEWQCGLTACRARLPSGRGAVLCQALDQAEGLRVLQAVFSRYGQTLEVNGGFRVGTGSPPTDSQGRGGLRVQTTVRFHCCSYADQASQFGPVYPAQVLARGPSQWA